MKNLIPILIVFILIPGCVDKSIMTEDDSGRSESQRIRVYLLGSFHFAQTDSTYNIFEEGHQKSIKELCQVIASQKPSKVFVERQPEYEFQNKIDSLYLNYTADKKLYWRNELFQVGFRVADILGHKKVYQCDHPGRFGYLGKKAIKYAKENGQSDILNATRIGTVERYDNIVDEDSIMQNSTLFEYVQWINSDLVMNTSHAFYIANYTQLGSTDYYNYDEENSLLGAEVIADWYRRNIMIYSKMINQVDYEKDDAIFLVIGSDHIPILKSLFDANPHFEVEETSRWLHK